MTYSTVSLTHMRVIRTVNTRQQGRDEFNSSRMKYCNVTIKPKYEILYLTHIFYILVSIKRIRYELKIQCCL